MYSHLHGREILEMVPSWFLPSHFIQLQILFWLLVVVVVDLVVVVPPAAAVIAGPLQT